MGCDRAGHLSTISLAFHTKYSRGCPNHAASLKRNKSRELDATHIFVPIAVETLGTWKRESLEFIHELGRRISIATRVSRETSYLRQTIGVAIQVGSAASFAGTLPSGATEAV